MRKEQTRRESMVEQIFGQVATLAVAIITAEIFVYDIFGLEVSVSQNISIMTYFAAQSILVRYFIRRYFEQR